MSSTLAESYAVLMWFNQWTPVAFVAALGAIVGSFLNVVVYRLPRGEGVVTPPSRCPACETRLTWRENIPVLGWLIWRGKCRYCRSPVSAEYPIVEAFTALLFGGLCALWYASPTGGAGWFGLPASVLKPEWAISGAAQTWPVFGVILVMFSCLIAMTLIDARTSMIPLALPFVATAAAMVVHPAWAAYIQHFTYGHKLSVTAGQNWFWTLATPGPENWWWWIGASLGATLGLGVAMVLMRLGLIRRSFADYEEWEQRALAEMNASGGGESVAEKPQISGEAGVAPSQPAAEADSPAEMWIAYPHARREMFKELAFLGPAAGLGWFGGWLAERLTVPPDVVIGNQAISLEMTGPVPPMWLLVLCGVLMGYLIGGGIVWAVRILGSLAFGKEAMGLGDVHLLAAVGACVGWIDAVLAFFVAAFVGLALTVAARVVSGRTARTLPYGPSLAIATLLVVVGKPGFEWLLTRLFHADPPINIP